MHTIFERLYDNDIVSEDGFQVNSTQINDFQGNIVLIFHRSIFLVMGEERRPGGTAGEGSRHKVVHTILDLAQGGNPILCNLAHMLCITI